MSTYLTKGIVLRQEPSGDYDRRYVIYTEDRGKVMAIAKGASRITSKMGPHLQYFSALNLMLAPGKRQEHIAAATISDGYYHLSDNFFKLVLATYFLEAVESLVQPDYSDRHIYLILDKFLKKMADKNAETKDSIKIFNSSLFDLLSILGYQPALAGKTQRALFKFFNQIIEEVTGRRLLSLAAVQAAIGR